MTKAETLIALAEQVEAAEMPNAALDQEIGDLLWQDQTESEPRNAFDCYQPFTASVDAALSLVPAGAEFLVSSCKPGLIAYARGPSAVVGFFENAEASGRGSAATAALALTAAALRAQATLYPHEDKELG